MKFKRIFGLVSAAAFLCAASANAQAETLREALVSAYKHNPQMASALLSVKAASEGIALAKSGTLPKVGASANLGYNWSFAGGAFSDSSSYTVNLSYQQRLFDSMKTSAQIEQARAMTDAAAQALRNAEQNVLLSAANAYVAVVSDTQIVQLSQASVKFNQAQLNSAKDRLRIGEGTKTEVSQAQAALAQAVAAYQGAVNALRNDQASYELWVGHKPQNLALSDEFAQYVPATLEAALSSADANHPAIRSALAQVRAAQSASDAAQSAFGPTLDLIGSICAVDCFAGGVTGVSGSVKLTLSIPIYQGGALGASVRQANINRIKSEADAMFARDQVRQSVVAAWSGLANAGAQIEATQSAVTASQDVLAGVIEQRNVGQSTTLDVLNAQANLTSVKQGLVKAQSGRVSAAFALLAGAGELNVSTLHLPIEIQTGDQYRKSVEDIWAELRTVPQ